MGSANLGLYCDKGSLTAIFTSTVNLYLLITNTLEKIFDKKTVAPQ